jgi:hypothetical protein
VLAARVDGGGGDGVWGGEGEGSSGSGSFLLELQEDRAHIRSPLRISRNNLLFFIWLPHFLFMRMTLVMFLLN